MTKAEPTKILIRNYLTALRVEHRSGTEHTYRRALQNLLETLLPDIKATNEPKQIECGAPDLVLTRNQIPLGYIETKNLGKNLDDPAHKEQLTRYTNALDNLIFTNYLEFRLIRDKEQVLVATIGELVNGKIKPITANFDNFTQLLNAFSDYEGQTITSADDLAKRMAHKARLLANFITTALQEDEQSTDKSELQSQLAAFKEYLIHDLEPSSFADMYAQTVAYGLFAARLRDETPNTFTRREAAYLVPATNPFLQKFFKHIADHDLDERIRWIVDELADIFRATDVGELMKGYGKATQRNDPFLHFYETFLGEYNPKLRKSRGVYYTPEPVVNFIVRAVDEILKTEFNLPDGLADTSKNTEGVHKVQILDPATGTGTFLAAIVQQIYETKFASQQGIWSDYVKSDLIPRLNGFEVLMASYSMAHTKLEMVLRDSGCELGTDRLRIFLTNSLEEHHPDTSTLFAQWLSTEANEANAIKRDTPVMVVIGNPPYAVSSSNKGDWIQTLLKDYKKDLNERKLNLDDDYIKFIRYGEHLIEKTGEGILAYISNNSFLDGVTHRQMRKHLLETFDKIFIIDLHGNTRKKETAPDGSLDKNVFDIMQGVSINLFIKTSKPENALAEVFHFDLYGHREVKYNFLWEHDLNQVTFAELKPQEPYYFFVPKDFSKQSEYEKGVSINKLFKIYSSGIITRCDQLAIKFSQKEISSIIDDFLLLGVVDLKEKYSEKKESVNWNFSSAKADLITRDFQLSEITYRPFDIRHTVQTKKSSGFISRPGYKTMQHMIARDNFGLLTSRSFSGAMFDRVFISRSITDIHSASDQTYHFPLYLYPDIEQQTIDEQQNRKPNLDPNIVKTIADQLGLRFTPEAEDDNKTFAPIDLLDYIYAILHSPTYRKRYQEFLKIDFPRVPYPTDQKQFRKMVKLGAELRALHLLESPTMNTPITTYPVPDGNIVTKTTWEITDHKTRLGKVSINDKQYFGEVPETAWNFYIGGYQPAQKWLKDRKAQTLTNHDITYYQKIIVSLTETERLMQEIDKI